MSNSDHQRLPAADDEPVPATLPEAPQTLRDGAARAQVDAAPTIRCPPPDAPSSERTERAR